MTSLRQTGATVLLSVRQSCHASTLLMKQIIQWGFALKPINTGIILVFSLLLTNISWANENLDKQGLAEETLKAINLCIHWGGEEHFSEERSVEIGKGIERDCAEAQRKARTAFGQFPENKKLSEQLLYLNDFGYFGLSDDEKEQLCKDAASLFEEEFEQTNYESAFVKIQCPNQARKIYGK